MKEVKLLVRGHNSEQIRKEFRAVHDELGLLCASSAEAPTVDHCCKLESESIVNAANEADYLFFVKILPEYTVVLHLWPENDGSLCPGGQLCQDNKLMFFLLCPGGSVGEGRWSSFQRIVAFAIVIEKKGE